MNPLFEPLVNKPLGLLYLPVRHHPTRRGPRLRPAQTRSLHGRVTDLPQVLLDRANAIQDRGVPEQNFHHLAVYAHLHLAALPMALLWGACDRHRLRYRDSVCNHLPVRTTRAVVEQIHRWDVHRQFEVLVSKRVAEHYDGCGCIGTADP